MRRKLQTQGQLILSAAENETLLHLCACSLALRAVSVTSLSKRQHPDGISSDDIHTIIVLSIELCSAFVGQFQTEEAHLPSMPCIDLGSTILRYWTPTMF